MEPTIFNERKLTVNIMNPGRTFHEKNVVTQKEKVKPLKHQEDMPCCWSIRIDINRDDSCNELWRNDSDSSCGCNPAQKIDGATAIALYKTSSVMCDSGILRSTYKSAIPLLRREDTRPMVLPACGGIHACNFRHRSCARADEDKDDY
jgi:hypothetical protein